jgi:uncharacterized protein
VIDDLIAQHPFYRPATIPGGLYLGNPDNVHTFGVRAILAASEDLDEEVAYQMVKSVFENLENFKTLHPVFASLNAKDMTKVQDLAPLHPGAARYFKEKGLLD